MTSLLQDKLFISTRPKDSSEELTRMLTSLDATVIEFPLIEIKAALISEKEKQYFSGLNNFQWIVFTSPNGVRHFFDILFNLTGTHNLPEELQLAAIGEKTEQLLNQYGYKAAFVNPGNTAEDFSAPFLYHLETKCTNPKILLPLGNLARTVIQDQLKDAAECVRIEVYKTELPDHFDKQIIRLIETGQYDMIIFTSPSGIRNFLKVSETFCKKKIRMLCIGPVTHREAIENGFHPLVTAKKSSADGIVESILNYYISKT